jgi:hypothetical protein
MQLLDDIKAKYRSWNLKEDAVVRSSGELAFEEVMIFSVNR